MTINDAIKKIVEKRNLTREEAYLVMKSIMSGQTTPSQIAAYLTALRMKGEDVDELAGSVQVMREMVDKIEFKKAIDPVDTCGTGGDAKGTFNISTAAAFVAAGAGVHIAKHGNKAVSSSCGSADVLTGLGVKVDIPRAKVTECIENIGIGFLFAPNYHPAMKYAQAVRQEIKVRTIFNILGPLANPALAKRQLIGVYTANLVGQFPKVLQVLGSTRVMVVHGDDGLDEITLTGPTRVGELCGGKIREYSIAPESFGLPKARFGDLMGGDVRENVRIINSVLDGERGPKRDIVVANAAAVLVVAGKAKDLLDGVEKAEESIDQGQARNKLDNLVEFTQGA